MKVGILGGTFDPPHRGHLHAASQAQLALGLDEVLFVPCHQQPLKQGRPVASAFHRAAMVALAIARHGDWSLEMMELERGGPSYTAETLDALRRARPSDRLHLILGEDGYRSLERWHRWEDVVASTPLIVIARPGGASVAPPESVDGAEAHWVRARPIPVSSSMVRERLSSGRGVRSLVPAPVAAYISRQGLYGAGPGPGALGR